MSELNEEQTAKIEQFKEITSFEEEQHEDIVKLLTYTNWNLEISISKFFDGNYLEEINQANANIENVETDTNVHEYEYEYEQEIRHRATHQLPQFLQNELDILNELQKPARLPKANKITNNWKHTVGIQQNQSTRQSPLNQNPILIILLLLPRSIIYLGGSIFNFLSLLFPKFFIMLGYIKTDDDFPVGLKYDDLDKEGEDVKSYETIFKEIVKESFSELEYKNFKKIEERLFFSEFNELFERVKKEYEWLLIVIVNDKTNVPEYFQHESFVNFLNDNKVNVFVNNVFKSNEVYEVGKVYNVKKLPYVGLVANITNSEHIMSSMSILYERQLFTKLSPKKLIKNLAKLINLYEPQLIIKRDDLRAIEMERSLKSLQDQLFQESLNKDKQRKQEREEKKRIEQEAKDFEINRKWYMYKYFIHNYELIVGNGNGMNKDCSTIKFRLNNGEIFIKKFDKELKICDVYKFISFRLYLVETGDDKQEYAQLKDKYEAEMAKIRNSGVKSNELFQDNYKFELVQLFPKKSIEKSELSIGECEELYPQGNLLIEYLDEEYIE